MFEDCKQEHQLFNSTDDWFNHMRWQHTLEWSCQAPGHEDRIFHAQPDFEQHMRSHHAGSFTEFQLPTLISKSAKPSSSTFHVCPLCHDDLAVSIPLAGPDDPVGIATFTFPRNFRHHIAPGCIRGALSAALSASEHFRGNSLVKQAVNSPQSLFL
jgi:hypothetical protein